MDKKLFGIILVVVVGVIMAGSLLAPIVSDYADEEKIYYNEGMPFAEVDTDTHTIVIDSTAITVDDEEIDQTLFPTSIFDQYTIVYGDSGFIRMDMTSVIVRNVWTSGIANYDYSDETVTVTIVGDVATVTSTDTESVSTSISDVSYYIATSGDLVLSLNPVVNSDSVMYGAGQTTFTTSNSTVPDTLNVYTIWSGTISNVSASVYKYADATVWSACAVSDTTVNTTALDNGLYQIDSVLIDYTATYDSTSTDYEVTSTYTYFLAPSEVGYENPTYLGSATSGLLAVVVVMFLVALIIIPTRLFNRDD